MSLVDRNDLQTALKEVVESAEKASGQHGGPRLPNMIPPLRIHASRAKSEVSLPATCPVGMLMHSKQLAAWHASRLYGCQQHVMQCYLMD